MSHDYMDNDDGDDKGTTTKKKQRHYYVRIYQFYLYPNKQSLTTSTVSLLEYITQDNIKNQ